MNIIGNVCFWHGLGLALFAQISGTFFANKNEFLCLAKANPTPFISKQISLKRWDE